MGTERHILTDKNGIPLFAIIYPANTHDINLVIDVIDNAAMKREKIEGRIEQEDYTYVWKRI